MGRKVFILLGVAAAAGLFFALGLHRFLSFEAIKASQVALVDAYRQHPVLFVVAFVLIEAAALALCIPGILVGMALVAGAVFGLFWGTLIMLCAVVLGDSLAFLLSRYLLRDWVRARFAAQFVRIDRGFERYGAFYLLSLRLMAVIPFFVVNMAMGLTRMRLRVFAPVSFVGLIPATLLHVNVGTQLGRIRSIGEILSWPIILSFAALAIAPLVFRYLLLRWTGDDQLSSAERPIAMAPIGPAIAPNPGGPTSTASVPNEP